MSATVMLAQWRATVKEELLPELHGHQCKALADLSLGMVLSGNCQSGAVAAAVPSLGGVGTKPASTRRRWERLLGNGRLRARQAMHQLTRAILQRWSGRSRSGIVLILDETPKANDLRCLKVSVAYRKRAVPLSCLCYRGNELPQELPKLVWKLLRAVGKCLPPDCSGFGWQKSRVNDPDHALHLMLLMALAMLLAISIGSQVLKRGLRRCLESTRTRKLSVFQLGLRWNWHAPSNDKRICCRVYLYPA